MPLRKGDTIEDELAVEAMKVPGARSNTDAARKALLAQRGSERVATPLIERIRPILEGVDRLGSENPRVDMKRFRNEMWGDG